MIRLLISAGLTISGLSTWVLVTIIVWLAALIAGLILPLILVKRVAEDRRGRLSSRPSTARALPL